jgi:hypothetical protein
VASSSSIGLNEHTFLTACGVGYQASYLFFSYLVFFKQLCQFKRMTSFFSSCFGNFIDLQEFVVCMSPYANVVATLLSTTFSFFLRFAKHFPISFSLIFFSSVVAIINFDFHMVLKYFKNFFVFFLCNFFFSSCTLF